MRVVKQNKGNIAVIFSLHEMETIDFLLKRGIGNHFTDTRDLVEQSLSNLQDFLEHYSKACEHGY